MNAIRPLRSARLSPSTRQLRCLFSINLLPAQRVRQHLIAYRINTLLPLRSSGHELLSPS